MSPIPAFARFRGAPIVGALLHARRSILDLFERAAALGEVVQIDFPGRCGYLLKHPDDIRHVLVDRRRSYGKQTRGYQMLRLTLGHGLLTSEGEYWRRQRRIAQPAFHHQRISGFASTMTHATEDMLARWARLAAGTVINVDEEMMGLTLKIVGLCLMSTDLSDETSVVGPSMTTVLEETVRRIPRVIAPPLYIPTPANVRFNRALARIDAIIEELIANRICATERPNDLLTMFIEARDEETGEGMTPKQLRDEVMTMVTAGHETTANALTWNMFLLSQNPEARARLEAELETVLGGRTPTLEDLPELTYTDAVVRESIRLYPPAFMVTRSACEASQIRGVEIPKGSMVFLAPWITHRDPRWWERPDTFEPERFLTPESEQIPKYAYFPFGGGPRVCIGSGFAMMETKLILATLAQRFRLRLADGHPVVPEPTITLRPKFGMRMHLEPR